HAARGLCVPQRGVRRLHGAGVHALRRAGVAGLVRAAGLVGGQGRGCAARDRRRDRLPARLRTPRRAPDAAEISFARLRRRHEEPKTMTARDVLVRLLDRPPGRNLLAAITNAHARRLNGGPALRVFYDHDLKSWGREALGETILDGTKFNYYAHD